MITFAILMKLKIMITIMMNSVIIQVLGSTLSDGETEGLASLPLQAGQTQPESHLLALTGWYQHRIFGKGIAPGGVTPNQLSQTIHGNP